MTLVQKVWKMLDDDMLALMQPAADTNFDVLKARMRAFAEVLAIFMHPHFETSDDIAREAKRRYDNRLNPEYETAGLNSRRYEPPPGDNKYARPGTGGQAQPAKSVAPRRSSGRPPMQHKFTDQEVEAIKLFAKNGFSKEQLAKTYGVGVAVIDTVLAS